MPSQPPSHQTRRPRRAHRLHRLHGPRRTSAALGAAVLLAGALGATAAGAQPRTGGTAPAPSSAPTSAVATGCPTGWGSTPESLPHSASAAVVGLRAGQHACYDRLVVQLSGAAPGYRVAYAAPGGPEDRRVAGGAAIVVQLADTGYSEMDDVRGSSPSVTGFRTFRELAPLEVTGTGPQTSRLVVGVRARLPFHVTLLEAGPGDAGPRLVLDVAHTW